MAYGSISFTYLHENSFSGRDTLHRLHTCTAQQERYKLPRVYKLGHSVHSGQAVPSSKTISRLGNSLSSQSAQVCTLLVEKTLFLLCKYRNKYC